VRPTRTPTATPALAPSIVISPTEGTVGTAILVMGTGWLPNDRVTLAITPPRVQPARQAQLPVRVRADRNGNFRAIVTAPADNRLIGETVLWVVATGSRSTRAVALFTMLPPDLEPAPIFPATPLPPPVRDTPPPSSEG
jgi:hypothetical protein